MSAYIRPAFHKGRPAADYRGAHVLTPNEELGEIVALEYREIPPAWFARLLHFNGDPFPGMFPLEQLRILSREET